MIFDLIKFRILPSANTVVNVSKNNLFTTVTVLDGMVTISDEEYSGEVVTGQQLQIQSFKTLEESFATIGIISDDFRASDWYTVNNGDSLEVDVSTDSRASSNSSG